MNMPKFIASHCCRASDGETLRAWQLGGGVVVLRTAFVVGLVRGNGRLGDGLAAERGSQREGCAAQAGGAQKIAASKHRDRRNGEVTVGIHDSPFSGLTIPYRFMITSRLVELRFA